MAGSVNACAADECNDGATALHLAASRGKAHVIEALLREHGAERYGTGHVVAHMCQYGSKVWLFLLSRRTLALLQQCNDFSDSGDGAPSGR